MKNIKTEYDILRQKIYITLYGTNTFIGKLFNIILLFVILLSVLLVMLESVKPLDNKYHNFLVVSEWVITIFFSTEYLLRIISTRKPLKYIFSFYGIIDLISILPMYLSFFIPNTKTLSIIRALRLLRVFRILNLVQFSGQAIQLKNALQNSRNKIIVFVYFVFVISIFLGTVMYIVESSESGFTSIPKSIYWCIVTLTTVGYGDVAPITPIGQTIATFIMVLGYGIIAVPTGIITSEFNVINKKSHHEKLQNGKICRNCNTKVHIEKAFFCYHCGTQL